MLRNSNKNNGKPVFNANLSDINFSDDSDLSSSHLPGLVENKKCFKIPFERAKRSEESFDRIFDSLSQSPVPKNKKPRLTLLPDRQSTKIIINERNELDGNDVSFASPNFSHVNSKPKFSYCKKTVSAVNKENNAVSNVLNMSNSSVENSFSGLSIKKRTRFQMARPAITARRSVLLDSSNTSVNNSFLMPKKKRCKIFQRPVAKKVLTISSDNDSDCSYISKSKRRKIFKMPPKIYNNEINTNNNNNDSIGDILDVSHDSSDYSLVRNRKLRKRFVMPLTDDQKVQLATISTVSDSDNVSDISTADLRKTIYNRPKFKMPPKQHQSTTAFSDEDSSIELNGAKNESNAESVEILPSSFRSRDNSFDSDNYISTQSTVNSPVSSSCNGDVSIQEVFSLTEDTDKSYDENNTELVNTTSGCSFHDNDSSDLIYTEDVTLLENSSALKNTNSNSLLEDDKSDSIKPAFEAKCGTINVEVRKSESDCGHNLLVQSSVDNKNKIYNNSPTCTTQRSTNKSELSDNSRGDASVQEVFSVIDDSDKSYIKNNAESETSISNCSSDDCNTLGLVRSESTTLLENDLSTENINCNRLSQNDNSDTTKSDCDIVDGIKYDESNHESNLIVNSLVDNDNEIYNNATFTTQRSTHKSDDLSGNSHDNLSVQEVFSVIDDSDKSYIENNAESEISISNRSSDDCNNTDLVRNESATLLENDLTIENINCSRLSQNDKSYSIKSDCGTIEGVNNDESGRESNLIVNSLVDSGNENYNNATFTTQRSTHKSDDLSDNSHDDLSVQEVFSVMDDSGKSYTENNAESKTFFSNRSFDHCDTSHLIRSESATLLENDLAIESINCSRLSQNDKSDTIKSDCGIIEGIKNDENRHESNLIMNSLVDIGNEIYNNATFTTQRSAHKLDELSVNSHDNVSVQEVFSVMDDSDKSYIENNAESETSISNCSSDDCNTLGLVRSESTTLLENDLSTENINCNRLSQNDNSDTTKSDCDIVDGIKYDESNHGSNLIVNSFVDNGNENYNNATFTTQRSTHKSDDLSGNSHDNLSVQEVFSVIDDSDKSYIENNAESEISISNRSSDDCNNTDLVRNESATLLENDLTIENINCSRLSQNDKSYSIKSDCGTIEGVNNDESGRESNLIVNSLVDSGNENYNNATFTTQRSTHKSDDLSDNSHDDLSVQEVFSVMDDSGKSYVRNKTESETSISIRSSDDCNTSDVFRSESVTLLEADITSEKIHCSRLSRNDKSDPVRLETACQTIGELEKRNIDCGNHSSVNSLIVDETRDMYISNATASTVYQSANGSSRLSRYGNISVEEVFSLADDSEKSHDRSSYLPEENGFHRSFGNVDISSNVVSDSISFQPENKRASEGGCFSKGKSDYSNSAVMTKSEKDSDRGACKLLPADSSVRDGNVFCYNSTFTSNRRSTNGLPDAGDLSEIFTLTEESYDESNVKSENRISDRSCDVPDNPNAISITNSVVSPESVHDNFENIDCRSCSSSSGNVKSKAVDIESKNADDRSCTGSKLTNSLNGTGQKEAFGNATFTFDRAATNANLTSYHGDVGVSEVFSLIDNSDKSRDKNNVKNFTSDRLYTDCSTIYGDSTATSLVNERTLVEDVCDNDRLSLANKCDSVNSVLFETTVTTISRNENEDNNGCENKSSADTENTVICDNLTFTARRSTGGSSKWNNSRRGEEVAAESEKSFDGSKSENFVINCSFDDGENSYLSRNVSVGLPDNAADRSFENNHDHSNRLKSDNVNSFSEDVVAATEEGNEENAGKPVIGSDKPEISSNHLISPKLSSSDGANDSKIFFAANENRIALDDHVPVHASTLSRNGQDALENTGRLPKAKQNNKSDRVNSLSVETTDMMREEENIESTNESGSKSSAIFLSKNDEDEIHYSKDPNFTKCSSNASSYKSLVDSLIKARSEETDYCTDITDFTCDCPSGIASSSRIIELSCAKEKSSSNNEILAELPDNRVSCSERDADDDLPITDTVKCDDDEQQRQRLEEEKNCYGYSSEKNSERNIRDIQLEDVKLNEINNSLLKSDLFAVIDGQQNVLDYSEIGIADETNFSKKSDENKTVESENATLSKSDNYSESNSSSFKSAIGDSSKISGHSDSIGLSLYASGRLSSLVLSADSATTSGLSLYASGHLSNSVSDAATNDDDNNTDDRENCDNNGDSNRSKRQNISRKMRSSVRLSAGDRSAIGKNSGTVNGSILSVRGSPYSLRRRTNTTIGRNSTITSSEKSTKITTRSSTKKDGEKNCSLSNNQSKTSVNKNNSNLSLKTSTSNAGKTNSKRSFKTSISNVDENNSNQSFKTSISNVDENNSNQSFKMPHSNTDISARRSRSSEKPATSNISKTRSCSVQSRPSRTRNKNNNSSNTNESEINRSIKNRSLKSISNKISISVVDDSVRAIETSAATATIVGGTSISLVTKVFGKRSATPIIEDSMMDMKPRVDIATRKNRNKPKRASKNVQFPKFSYWCTKRLYSHVLEKIGSEYGIRSNRKLLQIVRYLDDQVNRVISLSGDCDEIISEIKLMLAEQNIIISTFDFYQFCHSYMPIRFVNKAVPIIQPFGRPLNVSFDPSTLFKPIINLQISAEMSNSSASE